MASVAREAALTALIAWRKGGAWSDSFIKDIIKKDKMDSRDAALCTNICYGVLQNLYLCDFYISEFCSTKPDKLQPVVRDILRIAIYQLLFLDRIPQNAAVNEAVSSARLHANPKAAGMVNAVLRAFCRSYSDLPKPTELSVRYSHPKWLCDEFINTLGNDGAEKLLAANNSAPEITVQVNTTRYKAEDVTALLVADGVKAKPHPWLKDCLLISDTGNIEALAAFNSGAILVQDAAARLAVIASGVTKGQTVIDGCAAPGGKSFAAAIQMEDNGKILSFDIHPHKIDLINKGAQRLGLSSVEAAVGNAKEPLSELYEAADVVLADVPCSGFGVIRKKPEIRYKGKDETENLPAVQLDILRGLSRCVKPGGCLLYSTCTILEKENSGVVEAFLSENKDFYPEAFTLPGDNMDATSGMLTLYPHIHGTDGFFICKLRKNF